jgi:hypothetical protein
MVWVTAPLAVSISMTDWSAAPSLLTSSHLASGLSATP